MNHKDTFDIIQSDAYQKKLPTPKTIYVIDFFCGCGGMTWGFANTRQSHYAFKILAGIDIERPALKTYQKNFGVPGIEFDIKKIAESPSLLVNLVKDFDPLVCRPLVFIGCAPCQGFSAHRKKDERDDPRNNLMAAFAKICGYYKPDIVVMENVPEIINGKYKHYWQSAENIFNTLSYKLSSDILDLNHFGVPQKRKRAVIIGSLKGIIPLPKTLFSSTNSLTVRNAISHLEMIDAGATSKNDIHHRAPNHTSRILDRIKKTPLDGGDRRSLPESDQLDCHRNVDNSNSPGFTDVYGRLRWDAPSVTITAKSSTPSCGRFLHPEQHRNITVREAAILQGFPQNYEFEGSMISQYRQIGEAVPPLFSRFLAWQILDHYNPRPQSILDSRKKNKNRNGTSNSHELKIIDCFSGAGGLSLGFEYAGFTNVLGIDNNLDALKTFGQNISENTLLADLGSDAFISDVDEFIQNSDYILVGGPPCQGFSQQRRGEDIDPRNNLVMSFGKLVEKTKTKPLALVLENVTYLDSPRGKKILSRYINYLSKHGYKSFRHDLNSADFNVPQLRKRIIIVSIQQEMASNYTGPSPLSANRWPIVGEYLTNVSEFGVFDSNLKNHDYSKEGELNKRRISFVDMGKGRLSIPDYLQLECHKKYGGHLDVYGRLDWFSQARTITGGFDSFTRGEFGHPFFHRSITPREAARIQGFPDWFEFLGNKASIRKQIGNAVPPPMGYAIAMAIKECISLSSKLKICL